jgi:hypothetical protein
MPAHRSPYKIGLPNLLWIEILAMLFIVVACAKPTHSAESLNHPSWPALEKEIEQSMPQALAVDKGPADYVFYASTMLRIRDSGSPDLWLEMSRQKDQPLVAVGGFLCMKQRKPERAFEAALTVVSSGATNASDLYLTTYLPAILYLTNAQPTPANLATFSRLAGQKGEISRFENTLMFSSINVDFANHWLEKMPTDNINPGILAGVVDGIAGHCFETKQPMPPKALAMLDSFAKFSDARGIVFICDAPENSPHYKEAWITVLQNEQLNDADLIAPLASHIDYVVKNIPYQELDLRPKLLKRIERIRKIKQEKGPAIK